MTDIFISYSRDDETIGHEIYTALKDSGRDLWMDWASVPLTAEWWTEIKQGIEVADQFMFLVSPSSVASPICNLELDYARSLNKRILPVEVRPTDGKTAHVDLIHKSLTDYQLTLLDGRDLLLLARDNWHVLETYNRVRFIDGRFATNFRRLAEALEIDIECVRTHTRLLIRAQDWERRNMLRDSLLYGEDLSLAEAWLAQNVCREPAPLKLHRRYIEASREAENERLRRVSDQEALMILLNEKDTRIKELELELEKYRGANYIGSTKDYKPPHFNISPEFSERTHHIFLSYSWHDEDIMRHIRSRLVSVGFRVWSDETLQFGTPDWQRAIEQAISSSDCIVALLTPDSFNSRWVRVELSYANTRKIPTISVLAKGDPKDSIPLFLVDRRWIDIRTDFEEGMFELETALLDVILKGKFGGADNLSRWDILR